MFMPTGGPPNSNLPTNTRVTWINRKQMPMGTKCHFQTWDGLLGELSHSANVGRILTFGRAMPHDFTRRLHNGDSELRTFGSKENSS